MMGGYVCSTRARERWLCEKIGGKFWGKGTTLNALRKLEDDIKMNLMEIRCELDSCGLEYGPVAGSCEIGNELSEW
jgi:hypothetical protein